MIQVMVTNKGITYDQYAFYQYDTGQKVEIHGLDANINTEIHIARRGSTAVVLGSDYASGALVAEIPDDLFKQSGEINVYIYTLVDGVGKTIHSIPFYVKAREMPEGYNVAAYTLTEKSDHERIVALEDAMEKLIMSGLGVV